MESAHRFRVLAVGGSSYISTTDNPGVVLKGYQIWEDGRRFLDYYEDPGNPQTSGEENIIREAAVYQHLGNHPLILRFLGLQELHPGIHSLRLELAPLSDVRFYIKQHPNEPLSLDIRLRMATDAARGLAYLHSKQVQYCDLSCRNLMLFDNLQVKLGDFGAALIEGRYSLRDSARRHSMSCWNNWELPPHFRVTSQSPRLKVESPRWNRMGYKPLGSSHHDNNNDNLDFINNTQHHCAIQQHELPLRGREFESRPARKRELFALGSAIYEITTWQRPWEGLEDDEVEARYGREEFPEVGDNVAGSIVTSCWKEKYANADEVVRDLEELIWAYRKGKSSNASLLPTRPTSRSWIPLLLGSGGRAIGGLITP